jgi:putative transposase
MKAKRFTEEQIIGVLKEAEAGAKTKDLCRKHGVSTATFYTWKAKYAGMTVSEARRLKELEAENSKLNNGGSWIGVRRPSPGCVGLSSWCESELYPPGQADRECLHRKLQRTLP